MYNPASEIVNDYVRMFPQVIRRPSPSPDIPAAFEIGTCPKCEKALVTIEGNTTCACEFGHVFSFPELIPMMEV